MRISDWSSDVCSSDLVAFGRVEQRLRLFGLGDPRRAIKDEGRADMRFVEQQLRLQQFELEPHRPQVFAQQEIHVLKGEAVRRMLGLGGGRSEEHTSELQSLMRISYAVFCLKKKKKKKKLIAIKIKRSHRNIM